jgi:3-isopropylmalate dehydratase
MCVILLQNTFKNGMLPIVLPKEKIDLLAADAEAKQEIEVDLPKQVVRRPNGEEIPFEVNDFRKQCLINGWDDISLTLKRSATIDAFEEKRSKTWPWLDGIGYKGKVPLVAANEPKKTDW